jgi:hypothetical protein
LNLSNTSGLIAQRMAVTPPATVVTWSDITTINHDKAWNVLRRLERENLLVLFARALRFVPPVNFEVIFGDHAHPDEIGDAVPVERTALPDAVREFVEAARRSEFYEEFVVSSHNCTETSRGTQAFQAQLDLLFDRCMEEASGSDAGDVVEAYDLLFELLREIDRFDRDDIVFFADEGGVWPFNINWKRVLPPFLRSLASVLPRADFERRAQAVIEELADPWERAELQQAARGA